MSALMQDAVIAGELLRLAAKLGEEAYRAVHAAIRDARPELAPAELPERQDEAIAAETERLIKERFRRKTDPPTTG